MKVLLINDSTTNPNWGDRAAAISLMAMIRRERRPDHSRRHGRQPLALRRSATLSIRPPRRRRKNRAREIAKLFIPPVVLSVRRRVLAPCGRRLEPDQLIPERWEDFEECGQEGAREQRYGWPDLLAAMDDADVAVIHGDGAMEGNGIIPRTDLFLTYLIKKRFGKPVIIVNHTADFDHPALRRMAEEVYPLFDDVVFRDPISAERCESLCGGRFAADTAFWFEPACERDWAPLAGRPTYFDVWPHKAPFDPSATVPLSGRLLDPLDGLGSAEMATGYAALIEASAVGLFGADRAHGLRHALDQMVFEPLAARTRPAAVGVTTPVQQAVDILGQCRRLHRRQVAPGHLRAEGRGPVVALSRRRSRCSR